jgi:hypothetical protein
LPGSRYLGMMLIQVTAVPDAKLLAGAVRRCLRGPLVATRFAGVLAVLAGVFLSGGPDPVLLMAGAVVAVGLPIVVVARATRRMLRAERATTWEISDGGVASASEESRHSYAWKAFSYVDQLPGQLVFGRLFGRQLVRFLPVPTGGLSPAQIDEVLGAAAFHGLRVRRA